MCKLQLHKHTRVVVFSNCKEKESRFNMVVVLRLCMVIMIVNIVVIITSLHNYDKL